MEFFDRVAQLEGGREAFALATVVVRRSPVSSHLGDRAIVFADGRMEGFVGGSCSRDVVCRHAVAAIRAGRPRLLQIRTDGLDEQHAPGESDRVVIPMGCASEGAVDVYVEPHLPPRVLLAIGQTPVAHELARIGGLLEGYRVTHVASAGELRDAIAALDPGERGGAVAVVATQGTYDEAALELLLEGEPLAYVGLLASRKRAADVFGSLAQHGVVGERLASVRAPVGLDIGARRPSEVAISILAEIVAAVAPRRGQAIEEVEEEAHCMHCHEDASAT
jgi:xanthine dehydrogenase accessory factor